MHAANVPRETGAVVPAGAYQSVAVAALFLSARVEALTRQLEAMTPEMVSFGDQSVDLRSGAIFHNGVPHGSLTPVERRFLVRLARQPNVPVSYADFGRDIWGEDISAGIIRVYLSRVRAKIDPLARLLRVVHSFGLVYVP